MSFEVDREKTGFIAKMDNKSLDHAAQTCSMIMTLIVNK